MFVSHKVVSHQRAAGLTRRFTLALEWNGTKEHFMRTELVPHSSARPPITLTFNRTKIVLITQHGKPAAYLMAVEAIRLPNRRAGILEGIARGERAIEEGRVVTHPTPKPKNA
jgi:PHD/YefM family antitoxin component YafN of YafNO toxin-antitoxin module